MNTTPLEYPELWGLERSDKPGHMVIPLDHNRHEDQGALVYFSRDAAEEAAKHQLYQYDVECRPRRIVTTNKDHHHDQTV